MQYMEARVPQSVVISARSGGGMLSILGRLGHDLSVREDLAGLVVAAHTGDVLPRLGRHVALRVVQHDDVLHRRQKLKLALWSCRCSPVSLIFLDVSVEKRTSGGFGFGTFGLDGAHERREGHLAVLRRAERRALGGGGRGPVGELGPVHVLCRDDLAGVPDLRPEGRDRRRARRGRGQGGGAAAAAGHGGGSLAGGHLGLGAVGGFLGPLGGVGVLVGGFERGAGEPAGLAGGRWRWWWRGGRGGGGGGGGGGALGGGGGDGGGGHGRFGSELGGDLGHGAESVWGCGVAREEGEGEYIYVYI